METLSAWFKQQDYTESTALPKIAEPPADLHKRELPIREIDGQLFRISKSSRGKTGVIYFGKNKTERYDDPEGKFGVCYFGLDEYTAFIEVFGQALEIVLDLDFIYERALSTLKVTRKLKLVDITGAGAAWISAAGEVSSGDHSLSQQWARALYLHPENIDGIVYRCRHDLSRLAVALFYREPNLLTVLTFVEWSDTSLQALLGGILDHYHMGI